MTQVVAQEGESFESLMRRFSRRVQLDNVLREIKRREFYEKPSMKRKRKEAIKRRKSSKIGPQSLR